MGPTDNKISIISEAHTDNRFYDSLESYVDDVLGHTENWSKHMEILRDFFERVKKRQICVLGPVNAKLDLTRWNFWATHDKEIA